MRNGHRDFPAANRRRSRRVLLEAQRDGAWLPVPSVKLPAQSG